MGEGAVGLQLFIKRGPRVRSSKRIIRMRDCGGGLNDEAYTKFKIILCKTMKDWIKFRNIL